MEFQKVKVKRFAHKSFKHSQDGRYWKKFQSVYAQLEKGFMTTDISFCAPQSLQGSGNQPGLVATATAARVDIWKLQQSAQNPEDSSPDQITPWQSLRRFTESVTAIKLREDGQVLLAGDKMGKIELIELKQKLALRTYVHDHKNQINSLDFAANKRSFISSSNETSWKYYDIQDPKGATMTCQAAHSDNIKQVGFMPGSSEIVVSASSDKYVKIWRIQEEIQMVSQVRLNEAVEKFVVVQNEGQTILIVANGNLLSLVQVNVEDFSMKVLQNIHVFQKPVLSLAYDPIRARVIAGGIDQQLKFFEIFEENSELNLRLQYKIKLPQPVFGFGISADGQHYVVSLADGSLIIKSKELEVFQEEIDDEMKMVLNAFQPEFKQTSKNYKYFYRGQYQVMPEIDDVVQSIKARKVKIQKFEQSLKKFQYKKALDEALDQNNPEVVLALMEELIQRNSLELALANRNPEELQKLAEFIKWKIQDFRYQNCLVQVLRFLIDMYQGVLGSGNQPQIDSLFAEELRSILQNEIEVSENLVELKGQIEMLLMVKQISAN